MSTLDIPKHMKDLPEISAKEIRDMITEGKVHIKEKRIRGEALVALHEAIFCDVDVMVSISCIEGNIDFTKGNEIPIEDSERLDENRKENLKEKEDIYEVVELSGNLSIGMDTVILGSVNAEGVIFPRVSSFMSATFYQPVDFRGATFGEFVAFTSTIFQDTANFRSSHFANRALFEFSKFKKGVSFDLSVFGGDSSFDFSSFGDSATFGFTNFGKFANFSNASFAGPVTFRGDKESVHFEEHIVFNRKFDFRWVVLDYPEKVIFQHTNLRQAKLLETPFDRVQLIDVDHFWPRHPTENRKCVYDEIAPEEEAEKNYALIAQLYRQLKKNYEDQRDYPGAGDFHYGEMEMTRKMHWDKKDWFNGLMTETYKFLSGYGEAPGWSMYILLWIWVLPAVLAYMGQIMAVKTPPDFFNGLLESLLVSIKAMSLRLPEFPPTIIGKAVMIIQALLGPIQLALVALALRRKFRR